MKRLIIFFVLACAFVSCEKSTDDLHEGAYSIDLSEGGKSRSGMLSILPVSGGYKINISVTNYLALSGINTFIEKGKIDIPSQDIMQGTISGSGTSKEGDLSLTLRYKKSGIIYRYNISGKKSK